MNNEQNNEQFRYFDSEGSFGKVNTQDPHSLTTEEIEQELDQKLDDALAGYNDYRKQLIVQTLTQRGIDPTTIDVDSIVAGTSTLDEQLSEPKIVPRH